MSTDAVSEDNRKDPVRTVRLLNVKTTDDIENITGKNFSDRHHN